jgi:integrase
MATNIYTRGTTQWWRRSVHFVAVVNHPITVRMSLKTRCPREARARAGYLETEMTVVETRIVEELKTRIAPDDMRAVYRSAFEGTLDRYIVQQAATPFRADAHAAANLAYARYFTLMAETPELPQADEALRERLAASGLPQKDADALFVTVARHRGAPPISHNYLAGYLRSAGVKPTEDNLRMMSRVAAVAYRNACLAATEGLDRPNPEADVWPLPGPLRHLLGLPVQGAGRVQPVDLAPFPQTPAQGPTAPATVVVAKPARFDGKIDVTLSTLAATCLERKIDDREWREERRRDIDAVVNLFLAARGDLQLSEIDQQACSAMTALFSRLPTRYGHTREDIEGGMTAVIERGDALRVIWKNDPVAAERELVPTVGISDITHNKHVTWLSALFKFADANGYVTPDVDLGKLRRKVKGRKGGKRLPWAENDLRTLVSGPVWTGSKGLWDRLTPGDVVFHDGMYWGLPLVVCTGGRSEEPAGLMLADIYDEAEIPYIHFRDNAYRLLKNGQSDRKVPISPALIRLGFLDHVRAMRALGHELLFPEFYNPKASMSFDHVFYDKVFEPLRNFHFPDGTSQKRARKDVDVHSIRTRVASFWRDRKFDPGLRQYLLGHVPDGETAASYEDEPGLDLLLPLVTALGDLMPELPVMTLRLRPAEWQKFGSIRGRRAR